MIERPNILLILNDDMGYSDPGCYGGEIDTPNLDNLAANGVRFTQFYNTARCSPSRASLLTGLHPHQTGIGILTDDTRPDGYAGNLNHRCVTIAEVLKTAGYRTHMSGKWHMAHDLVNVNDAWPNQRGFDRFYGTIAGGGSYFQPGSLTRDNVNIEAEALRKDFYYTDAISDTAVQHINDHCREFPDRPFFQYVAYTAPHWPLHAKEKDIEKYKGRFDAGWDTLREERLQRMIDMGIIHPDWKLSPRDPAQPPWEEVENKEWQTRRMEVYAAQIDCMDQGIGRILQALKDNRQLDNTLIIFLADNGGCAEEIHETWKAGLINGLGAHETARDGRNVRFGNTPDIMPGGEGTYASYGVPWANLSNTPFRFYKHWVHEGGIATPFIVHWPKGMKSKRELRHQACQLPDVMATVLDVTGASYPATYNNNAILPLEGFSMAPMFDDPMHERAGLLFWEHEGNAAVRGGTWKLVKNYTAQTSATPGFDLPDMRGEWELYDMERDRTELRDVAEDNPEKVSGMAAQYQEWADRCNVVDREVILEFYRKQKYIRLDVLEEE
jgi:arylsulfatase